MSFQYWSAVKLLLCCKVLNTGHKHYCQLLGRMHNYYHNSNLQLSERAAKLCLGFMNTLFSTIIVQSVIDMSIIDVNSSYNQIAVVMGNVILIPVCSAHVVKIMTWKSKFIYSNYKVSRTDTVPCPCGRRTVPHGYHYENEIEVKSWLGILESLRISIFDFEPWSFLILKSYSIFERPRIFSFYLIVLLFWYVGLFNVFFITL